MVRVRAASTYDARAVVDIAAMMYDTIGEPAEPEWIAASVAAIESRLHKDVFAYVADDDGVIAASACASLNFRLPTPSNPRGVVAYVQWVGTLAGYRRMGLARDVMTALLDKCANDLRVHDVQLHSTLMAEPLYRSLGFTTGALRPLRRSPCVGE